MNRNLQKKRWRDKVLDWSIIVIADTFFSAVATYGAIQIKDRAKILFSDISAYTAWIEIKNNQTLEWIKGNPFLSGVMSLFPNTKDLLSPTTSALESLSLYCFFLVLFYPFLKYAISRLVLRYDDEAMRPTPKKNFGMNWAGPLGKSQIDAWKWIETWTYKDAESRGSPWWCPWMMPDVKNTFSIGFLVGQNGTGKSHIAESFMHTIQTKNETNIKSRTWKCIVNDVKDTIKPWLWWRHTKNPYSWDCGYIVEDSAAQQKLRAFLPRKATLFIADGMSAYSVLRSIEILNSRRFDFRHPVRLLIVDVTLPADLELDFLYDKKEWQMNFQEIGEVAVHVLTNAKFGVPEFRALIGAQTDILGERRVWLGGPDSLWQTLVEALDYQPVMLSEAYRMVRDENLIFEDLLICENLNNKLVSRQDRHETIKDNLDIFGVSRDILRERVLKSRAKHRVATIYSSLGDSSNKDAEYEALLTASIAQGCRLSELRNILGSTASFLSGERVKRVFMTSAAEWLPTIEPAVILDEMIRQHFSMSENFSLNDDVRHRVIKMMRVAWILNPSGTKKTVARWQNTYLTDEFLSVLRQLPTLADLDFDNKLDSSTRINIVRAFVELVIFHQGNLDAAVQSIRMLNNVELTTARSTLLSLLIRPKAYSLPSVVICLTIWTLSWLEVYTKNENEALNLARQIARIIVHLMRQSILRWQTSTSELRSNLKTAFTYVKPSLTKMANIFSTDQKFLDETFAIWTCDCTSELATLRSEIIAELASNLIITKPHLLQSRNFLVKALIDALTRNRNIAKELTLDLGWLMKDEVGSADDGYYNYRWGQIRCLTIFIDACSAGDIILIKNLALRTCSIASEFPDSSEIQKEYIRALKISCEKLQDLDTEFMEIATKNADLVSAVFSSHEGLQEECAQIYTARTWANKEKNVLLAESGARSAAAIAKFFPDNQLIQLQNARAWRVLAWANQYLNRTTFEYAVDQVFEIASAHTNHEGIQTELALALMYRATLQQQENLNDFKATAAEVEKIALNFPAHLIIQTENAIALKNLAIAFQDSDASAVKYYTDKISNIAEYFTTESDVQYEYTSALKVLALSHKNIDSNVSISAARRVFSIANIFTDNENIQKECANVWNILAEIKKGDDENLIETYANRVTAIAEKFSKNEDIQYSSALAWHHLAWAYKDKDIKATENAARHISKIARRFAKSEKIQIANVGGWRLVAWANRLVSVKATMRAAKNSAAVTQDFPACLEMNTECAIAWQNLAWASKYIDLNITMKAAENVSTIASNFRSNMNLQLYSAIAQRFLVESAIKFNDAERINSAINALNILCGDERSDGGIMWKSRVVLPTIYAERDIALTSVKSWKATATRN